MKEFKILAVVVFFSLVTYWGVEPFAHSQMHKHVEGNEFKYDGKADIAEAKVKVEEAKKAKKGVAEADAKLLAKQAFWGEVKQISSLKGDAVAGEAAFGACMGCHNGAGVNMGGVIPPNLDHAGSLYDKNYLIALIKNPAMASNTDHKFSDPMMHPMGSVSTMVTTPHDIANVVAYMTTKKVGKLTPKIAYMEACSRCHSNRYGKLTPLGETPVSFKTERDALAHNIKVLDEQDLIKKYMATTPPDLSIMTRARSEHFMETFIENPQSQLPGTSMPRTGLSEKGFEKVYEYLNETGDPSKSARAPLGIAVLIFFGIFTVLAYLWKKHQWHDLH
jgi:ubiquinol-cytochrome c reductase cytochrome c1 subunit